MVTGVTETRARPFYRPKKTVSGGREVESLEPSRGDQTDPDRTPDRPLPKKDGKRGRKIDISL